MNDTRDEAHIVGLGAQTSLGKTLLSSWAAVSARVMRLVEHPVARRRNGERIVVSMASYLAPDLPLIDRFVELASRSIEQALDPLYHAEGGEVPAFPVIIGLPMPREGIPSTFQSDITSSLVGRFVNRPEISGIRLVFGGNCAGMMAVAEALQLLSSGAATVCMAGGVDSYIDPATLGWLASTKRLPSAGAGGFFPGEGVGVCLICSDPRSLGLRSLARIASLSCIDVQRPSASGPSEQPRKPDFSTHEPASNSTGDVEFKAYYSRGVYEERKLKTSQETKSTSPNDDPDEPTELGPLSIAWDAVFQSLREGRKVTQTICDLNGEPSRSEEFTTSIVSRWNTFLDSQRLVTPCVSLGDVGAASGPLFLGLASCSIVSEPTSVNETLVTTMSEEGERCAALLENPALDDAAESHAG